MKKSKPVLRPEEIRDALDALLKLHEFLEKLDALVVGYGVGGKTPASDMINEVNALMMLMRAAKERLKDEPLKGKAA